MNWKQLLLVALVGFLLIQCTLAESKTKETKSEPAKKETPKAAEPKAAPKAAPKADTKKTDSKADPSFVDTYYPIAQEYANQAITTASKLASVAGDYAQEIGTHGAALAGQYYVVADQYLGDYKRAAGDFAYQQSVKAVDQFLDPQHAQIVKKNYLNWYGVAIIAGAFFGALLFLRRLTWLLSISALRAFLAATSLGAYGTLAAITATTSKDPLGHDKDNLIHAVGLYVSIALTVLNVLALLTLRGKKWTFLNLVISVGLFIDHLGLRHKLEAAAGPVPPHTLETLVFLLQTILIFDSLANSVNPKTVVRKEKTIVAPAPAFIKEEEIKKEDVKKRSGKAK